MKGLFRHVMFRSSSGAETESNFNFFLRNPGWIVDDSSEPFGVDIRITEPYGNADGATTQERIQTFGYNLNNFGNLWLLYSAKFTLNSSMTLAVSLFLVEISEWAGLRAENEASEKDRGLSQCADFVTLALTHGQD
jgi:hypothetical protein